MHAQLKLFAYLRSIRHLRFVQSVEPETQWHYNMYERSKGNRRAAALSELGCVFCSIPLVADERIV